MLKKEWDYQFGGTEFMKWHGNMFQTLGAKADKKWVTILKQVRTDTGEGLRSENWVKNLTDIVHWTVKLKIVKCDKTVKRKAPFMVSARCASYWMKNVLSCTVA